VCGWHLWRPGETAGLTGWYSTLKCTVEHMGKDRHSSVEYIQRKVKDGTMETRILVVM
jgi:hypothetical protein